MFFFASEKGKKERSKAKGFAKPAQLVSRMCLYQVPIAAVTMTLSSVTKKDPCIVFHFWKSEV